MAYSGKKIEFTMKTADRLLAEELIITSSAMVIRKKVHLPNPVGFNWSNIPTLFLRLKYYCLDHKHSLITLGQIRFNLIHLAVACNYRDSMTAVDELFDHLNKVMCDNEVDEATVVNIFRVVDGILQYTRVPNASHAAG